MAIVVVGLNHTTAPVAVRERLAFSDITLTSALAHFRPPGRVLRVGFMSSAAGPRIGFLGAGKMATALARGWLSAGLVTAENLAASDPVPAARQAFAAETGLTATANNREVVAASDLLVLAVKPQSMAALLSERNDAAHPFE